MGLMNKKRGRALLGLLALGWLLLVTPLPARAEAAVLPRAQLNLTREETVAAGVRQLTYAGLLADGQPLVIQVIEADLQNPEVQVLPVAAREGNYGKRESVGSMGASSGGIAAVNGGFFNTTAPYEPIGNFMTDGELTDSGAAYRISLGWFADGITRFGYFDPVAYIEGEPYWQGVRHLLTGGPLLVEDGSPIFQYGPEGYGGTLAARHPRTAVGVTPAGKMLLVTVDGRQPGVSVGATFDELAFLMLDLGAVTAMGLDGGGSTTLWTNGQIINRLSDGNQRLVANSIVVKSGIAVFIDGQRLYFDVPPRLEKGRTLVPLRAFFEGMGAAVDWYGETQTIIATKGEVTVKLVLDTDVAWVNDTEVLLEVPAQLETGRTLVPMRFIGEAFGAAVAWDPAKIITVNTMGEESR